jgi:tetratricopeptide (TPR) repeat protein
VRGQHFEYFLGLATEAEPELRGPRQKEWLARLEREHDNLRAALDCSISQGAVEAGLRLGGALWRYWLVRGYLTEGRHQLLRLLAMPGGPSTTAVRARALNAAGLLAREQSDYRAATTFFEESLPIWQELRDKQGIAEALNSLGLVAQDQGEFAVARAYFENSLAIRQELGEKHEIAYSLNNLGNILKNQFDFEGARLLHEESLAIKRELDDQRGIAYSLSNLGNVAYYLGDYSAARMHYEESLAIRRQLVDKPGIVASLGNLGNADRKEGDLAAARTRQQESLELAGDLGDNWGIAFSLEGFGSVAGAAGQHARATRLFAAAAVLRRGICAPLQPPEQAEFKQEVGAAREALGEAAFEEAWAEGEAMPLAEAIRYALEEME